MIIDNDDDDNGNKKSTARQSENFSAERVVQTHAHTDERTIRKHNASGPVGEDRSINTSWTL